MPPKKKEEAKPKPLIGRVGTNLKMGIVGLPNAGFVLSSSSFPMSTFSLLQQIDFLQHPHQIECSGRKLSVLHDQPERKYVKTLLHFEFLMPLFLRLGRVPVPDARFDYLCHHYEPLRYERTADFSANSRPFSALLV